MNDIPTRQNSTDALWLLGAREQTYREARVFQVLQFVATVVTPTAFAVLALASPDVRPYAAAASLSLLLLDVAFLDRTQAQLIKRAAKIAERFDCDVLDMKWNDFVAGKPADPEDIERAASRYPKTESASDRIRNWYPSEVGRAPLHVARIACQITNLRYDAELRKTYAAIVTALPFVVLTAALFVALAAELTAEALVLSILAPAAPMIIWALRERFRHMDTAKRQEEVKSAAEGLWARVKSCPPEECSQRAREFQDAIYTRRATSPLIFPFVYSLRRREMENEMSKGADKRLTEIGY